MSQNKNILKKQLSEEQRIRSIIIDLQVDERRYQRCSRSSELDLYYFMIETQKFSKLVCLVWCLKCSKTSISQNSIASGKWQISQMFSIPRSDHYTLPHWNSRKLSLLRVDFGSLTLRTVASVPEGKRDWKVKQNH